MLVKENGSSLDFDKFGYYKAGNRKTYSRQEAIEFAGEKSLEWAFNDEVFSLYDWTKEPIVDINFLYDMRTQQLRNDYDYIVLFYSGGYDSHNILRSFIDNDIHLDEIITTIPSLSIKSTPTIEYNNFTVKKLEKYKNKLLKTKIRLIEHYDMLIDVVSEKHDLLYLMNCKYTLYHLLKQKYKTTFKEHHDYIESGKKIAYVYGTDKPIIKYDSHLKQYTSQFHDYVVANKVLPEIQMNKIDDVSYEFFYWDPSCASLLIKQAHLIKNLYKIKKQEFKFDSPIFNYQIYPRCIDDSVLGFFNENSYRRLFNILNEKHGISYTACTGGRDSWFYRMNHSAPKKILDMISNISANNKTPLVKKYLIGQ